MPECRYGNNRVFWVPIYFEYVEYLTKVEGRLTSSQLDCNPL